MQSCNQRLRCLIDSLSGADGAGEKDQEDTLKSDEELAEHGLPPNGDLRGSALKTVMGDYALPPVENNCPFGQVSNRTSNQNAKVK